MLARKGLQVLYALREVVEDLVEEARSEAPADYLPTLEECVSRATTIADLLEVLRVMGFGEKHIKAYLGFLRDYFNKT